MKLKKGTIPMLLGLLLIAAALGLSVYNMMESSHAKAASMQAVNQLDSLRPKAPPTSAVLVPDGGSVEVPDYLLFPEKEMPVKTVEGYDYIGTLELPTLQLELPIISQWTGEAFQVAPCRYAGSAYLDNLILAAHNYPVHFGRIKELQSGDPAVFTDMDGNVFSYRMAYQEIVGPDDVAAMEGSGCALTLFTCTIGGQYRVTVRFDRAEKP